MISFNIIEASNTIINKTYNYNWNSIRKDRNDIEEFFTNEHSTNEFLINQLNVIIA